MKKPLVGSLTVDVAQDDLKTYNHANCKFC